MGDLDEVKGLSKTLINNYKKILMKTNDEIIMNDLLEAIYNKDNRSRVDLKNNNYIVVFDRELSTLYVYIADTNIDIARLEKDIILLTSFDKVANLFVNDLGKDIITRIISNLDMMLNRHANVLCMSIDNIISNDNKYTLRKATLEDKVEILSNILEKVGITEESELYDYVVKDVVGKIKNNEYYVLVDGDEILAQTYLFEYDDSIFIHGVLTNKDVRNKGIATDMISQLVTLFIEDNKSVYLSVLDNNTAAKRTYEKVGFKQIGESHYFSLT